MPDSSPPALGQAEALLVAKQGELTDLETAVQASADAVLEANADQDSAAVDSHLTELFDTVGSFVRVQTDYTEAREDYKQAATLAGRPAAPEVVGFDPLAIGALVSAELQQVSFLFASEATPLPVQPPNPDDGVTDDTPPAPQFVPPPLRFSDFGKPEEMTNNELDSWASWLEGEITELRKTKDHIQGTINNRHNDLRRIAQALRNTTNQAERMKLFAEQALTFQKLRDSEQELQDVDDLIEQVKNALKRIKVEQTRRLDDLVRQGIL